MPRDTYTISVLSTARNAFRTAQHSSSYPGEGKCVCSEFYIHYVHTTFVVSIRRPLVCLVLQTKNFFIHSLQTTRYMFSSHSFSHNSRLLPSSSSDPVSHGGASSSGSPTQRLQDFRVVLQLKRLYPQPTTKTLPPTYIIYNKTSQTVR